MITSLQNLTVPQTIRSATFHPNNTNKFSGPVTMLILNHISSGLSYWDYQHQFYC